MKVIRILHDAWCKNLPSRGVQVFTITWLLLVTGLLVLGVFGRWAIFPYTLWSAVVLIGSAAVYMLGIVTVLIAAWASRESTAKWIDVPWLFALVLFWAAFPPLWFMAEGSCYDGGVIYNVTYRVEEQGKEKEYDLAHCPLPVKRDFLKSLRESQDSAAKGWAAVGLLIGLIITQMGKG